MKKCPNGFYAEIKYDGERVQVHKNGDTFEFFSRSLKNVQPHKVDISSILFLSSHDIFRLSTLKNISLKLVPMATA